MENKRKWLNIFKEQEKYILVGLDKRANNYFYDRGLVVNILRHFFLI